MKNEDSSYLVTLEHLDAFTVDRLNSIVRQAFGKFKDNAIKRKDLMIKFSDLKSDVYARFHCSQHDCDLVNIHINISF